MLIEFIPVMLFILGWSPDAPGDVEIQRRAMLFASIEECEAEGAKVVAQMAAQDMQMQYKASCIEIPARDEFDELFKREFGQEEAAQ